MSKSRRVETITQDEIPDIQESDGLEGLRDEKGLLVEFPPKTDEPIELLDHDILAVMGTKQQGKTYFVKKEVIRAVKRPIIYSYYDLYDDIGNKTSKLSEVLRMIEDKEYPIVYKPPTKDLVYLEAFSQAMMKVGGVDLIFEEISDYVKFNFISPNFSSLVNVGANQGISMTLISTRPSHFHNDVKSRTLKLVIFRLVAPVDREYVERWTKISQDLLKRIERYHFIFIDYSRDTIQYHTPV